MTKIPTAPWEAERSESNMAITQMKAAGLGTVTPMDWLWAGILPPLRLLQTQRNVASQMPALAKKNSCHFRSLTMPSYFLWDGNSNRGTLQRQSIQNDSCCTTSPWWQVLEIGLRITIAIGQNFKNIFSVKITLISLNHQNHFFFCQGFRYWQKTQNQDLVSTRQCFGWCQGQCGSLPLVLASPHLQVHNRGKTLCSSAPSFLLSL